MMDVWHIVYILLYIGFGSGFSLFREASKGETTNQLYVEPVAVAFTSDILKLVLAVIYYFGVTEKSKAFHTKLYEFINKWKTARLFAIPAALYCVFNVLTFVSTSLVLPGTYRVLLNIKILFSGLFLQLLFNTRLTSRQWCGLVLLLAACVIEQSTSYQGDTGFKAIIMISIQALCSSFAGVYFQWLLQREQQQHLLLATSTARDNNTLPPSSSSTTLADSSSISKRVNHVNLPESSSVSLWEKNIYMYLWSALFNFIYLYITAPHVIHHPEIQYSYFNNYLIAAICCMAFGGFSTSLILRYMDVIVKEYANFAEMIAVVLGEWMILSKSLHVTTLIAVCVVSGSLYLYNVPIDTTTQKATSPTQATKDRATMLHNDNDNDDTDIERGDGQATRERQRSGIAMTALNHHTHAHHLGSDADADADDESHVMNGSKSDRRALISSKS